VSGLAEVLQSELEIVRQLLGACRQEQSALAAGDLAAIQQATKLKGDLARRLAALEQERQQVLSPGDTGPGPAYLRTPRDTGPGPAYLRTPNGAPAYGQGVAANTGRSGQGQDFGGGSGAAIANVAAFSNSPVIDGSDLTPENLQAALRQAVRELQEVNETNRFLARQSLAYVQKILALLAPAGVTPALMDRTV
jgi:flagellar biosynthesis/type III secretory pathway chaperone